MRGVAMALNYGRIVGFTRAFVTIHHPIRGGGDRAFAQSYLSSGDLKPPYRILRPLSRFDGRAGLVAFELDGREVLVPRDQVAIEKGSLAGRGRAAAIQLTQISVRQVKIWYGPPPEQEVAEKGIRLKVKPLRILVATFVAILSYMTIQQLDFLGMSSASDNYSDALYQQVYRAGAYERLRQQRHPYPMVPPRNIVVVELLQDDLDLYGETWPASYDFHAWVLLRIRDRSPSAVFVDIAFIDDRTEADGDGDQIQIDGESGYPFSGTSYDLGEELANYRNIDRIPLYFAATPCFRPFFLPEDILGPAPIQAVDVPGGRFHRQGARYPLWNPQQKGHRCKDDNETPEDSDNVGDTQARAETVERAQVRQPATEPRQEVIVSPGGTIERLTNEVVRAPKSLPSAACALYDAVSRAKDVCTPEKIKELDVDEIVLHWSTRSFKTWRNEKEVDQLNGRYACRKIPDTWVGRLLDLVFDFNKDRTFEFRSPLRQICPPFRSYSVAEILESGDIESDLKNAIVIYGQNLTGLEDRFTPPAHWPLNGVFFHAMATDNLLTYGGPDELIEHDLLPDIPNKLFLMFLGYLAVVPVWEYGFILLSRIETAGRNARTRKLAFRYYLLWVAGVFTLPLLAGIIVFELITVLTILFPVASLNFVGLFGLILFRSLPRAWRLVPPLWMGLGGWGRPARSPET